MNKYKLKATKTHNGTTTVYEDDVYFTSMITDVLNSKTLSNVTKEKDKLTHLTGGVILYTTNLDKSLDNIDIDEEELTYKLLGKNGKVTINDAVGHVGSICMTTKQNINNHDALKQNSQALETYAVQFEEQDGTTIYKYQDIAMLSFMYDPEYDWSYYTFEDESPSITKVTAETNDIYASLSTGRSSAAGDWTIEDPTNFNQASDVHSEFEGEKEVSFNGYDILDWYPADHPDWPYDSMYPDDERRWNISFNVYKDVCTVSDSFNVYEDSENFYFFTNTQYVEVYGIKVNQAVQYRIHGGSLIIEFVDNDFIPDEYMDYFTWSDLENEAQIEGTFPLYYVTESQYNAGTTDPRYWRGWTGRTTELKCKNRIVVVNKKTLSSETIDLTNKITSLGTTIGSDVLSHADSYFKYQKASTGQHAYRDTVSKGLAVVTGKYFTMPLATFLIAVDKNYYYFSTYEGNVNSNTYSEKCYKVNKTTGAVTDLGALANNISNINNINKNHTTYSTFRGFGNRYFTNSTWNSNTKIGNATTASRTTVTDLTTYQQKACRYGGLNGAFYIFYPGVCSISNFNFDLESGDTLQIEFKAGEYDEN